MRTQEVRQWLTQYSEESQTYKIYPLPQFRTGCHHVMYVVMSCLSLSLVRKGFICGSEVPSMVKEG